MKSNRQSKIKVNKSGFKRSRFNWSHDVNTTFAWGEIQPTQCKLLIPGSKTTMKTQNLIRLAPMPAPTFGRVKYKTYNQFVGMSEIFPNWDAMMAQMPKSTANGTITPSDIPTTKLGYLSQWVLHGARATLYLAESTSDGNTSAQNAAAGYYITAYRPGPNDDLEAKAGIIKTDGYKLFGSGKVFETISDPYFNANSGIANVGSRVYLDLSKIITASSTSSVFPTYSRVILGNTAVKELFPVKHEYTVQNSTDSKVPDYMKEVTFEGADYVIEGRFNAAASGQPDDWVHFAIAFELSDQGKRLRKILQGCGYQINFYSYQEVSILPLLAQYKAYFDVFGLQLYQGWETTYCAKIIKWIENDFVSSLDVNNCVIYSANSSYWQQNNTAQYNANLIRLFIMKELVNEWYTEQADYIGAHLEKLAVSPTPDGNTGWLDFISVTPNGSIGFDANVDQQETNPGANSVDNEHGQSVQRSWDTTSLSLSDVQQVHGYIDQIQHGEVDAEVLKRLYRWTNRNTILGREIEKVLRAQGLGKYVDECKSNFIGSSDSIITISDVISQSDTYNESTKEGAVLGQYGGRGLQYDSTDTLVFENDEYGYWITLATIVPEAGYTQGMDPTLSCVKKLQFYNPDFDALGMEMTLKSTVVGNSHIMGRIADAGDFTAGFGFIPRYSKFKVCQNLVNGDFNRHSKRNTYMPYTLDKQINVNDYDVTWTAYTPENSAMAAMQGTKLQRSGRMTNLPVAGNVWRTPTKYAWLGNFDRIFMNPGEKEEYNIGAYPDSWMVGFDDYNDDNFLSHGIYDVQCYAPMKPIEDSYGLDEPEPDHAGAEFVSKA